MYGNPSFVLMKSGAVALTANEVGSYIWYKVELEKLEDEYAKIVDADNTDYTGMTEDDYSTDDRKTGMVNAQKQAFDYMAKREDKFIKVATVKGGIYALTSAAFAASAVLATIEMIRSKTPAASPPCTPSAGEAPESKAFKKQIAKAGKRASGASGIFSLFGLFGKKDGGDKVESTTVPTQTMNQIEFKKYAHVIQKMAQENTELVKADFLYRELIALYNGDNKTPSIDEYEQAQKAFGEENDSFAKAAMDLAISFVSGLNPVEEAYAQGAPTPTPIKKIEPIGIKSIETNLKTPEIKIPDGLKKTEFKPAQTAEQQYEGSLSKFNQFMRMPITRAVLSGILSTTAGIMSAQAFKEVATAKKRKKYFENEGDSFMRLAADNIAPCTQRDRSNTAKPSCYCYTKYGAKNPKRQGSQICAKQWEKNPSLDPGVYDEGLSSNSGLPPVSCVNNNLRRDPKCSCRATNSCLKIGGKFKWPFGGKIMRKMSRAMDRINSGKLSGAELDATDLQRGALKLREATDEYIKQKGDPARVAKATKAVEPAFKYSSAQKNGFSPIGGSFVGGNSVASLAPELQKEIEEKMKAANVPGLKFKKGNMAKGNNSSKDDEFKFDFGDEATGGEGGVVVEGEQEAVAKFDYGQKDINQNDDTNLFDILSYRYKKSGLRRIYGDDDQAAVRDTANKTDISK
jgi:5-hydroxyisourate hydrolase-like protein (transthyretin family)